MIRARKGKLEPELPMHDFFNAMMWVSPDDYICSHRRHLRLDQLATVAREYDPHSVLEDVPFAIIDVPSHQ